MSVIITGTIIGIREKGGFTDKALAFLVDQIVDKANWCVKTAIKLAKLDKETKNLVITQLDKINEVAETWVNNPGPGGLIGLLTDVGLRGTLGSLLVNANFTSPLQTVMNDVVETLEDPSWEGGDNTRATLQTEAAIDSVRAFTERAHAEYVSTSDAYSNQYIELLNDILSLASAANVWAKAFLIINKVSELWIYDGTAVDCMTLGHNSVLVVSWTTYHYILPYYEPSIAGTLSDSAYPGTCLGGPDPALSGDALPSLETSTAVPIVLELASENASYYENLLRSLEYSIVQLDTANARTILDSLYSGSGESGDIRSKLYGPIHAGFDHGRLTIPGLPGSLEYVGSAGDSADSLKSTLLEFTESWLSDPDDESTRLLALNHVGPAVDAYSNFIDSAKGMILQLLTTPAVPSLVITNVQVPDRVLCGTTANVSADIQNLGAGTARNVEAAVRTDTTVAQPVTLCEVCIDSIMAGEEVSVDWELSFAPMNLAADSVYVLTLTLFADGVNALMDSRQAAIALVRNPTSDVDADTTVSKTPMVSVYPNPFIASTAVRFYLPSKQRAAIKIYSVQGRLVETLVDGVTGPGMHQLQWDGKSDQEASVAPGIYFIRMEAGSYRATTKVVMVK